MARYNMWQNESLVAACDRLDAAARQRDRGAFFGSIAGTLSHLLWADDLWMARLDGGPAPEGGIAESPRLHSDWTAYKAARAAADRRILNWADRLVPEALEGVLSWHSGAQGREVTRPRALCVAHFFNHQTHHRGQVHAMLTALGIVWGDTDLVFMPEETGT
ncbi:damage-inducible protein DinB [Maritimibacter sp. 55A14]|nr:DinB family protein [Maritimibacter sp. 55A14]PWE34428.1 damage-inducible protein DinB [Maritimibacter sp. 55A14]